MKRFAPVDLCNFYTSQILRYNIDPCLISCFVGISFASSAKFVAYSLRDKNISHAFVIIFHLQHLWFCTRFPRFYHQMTVVLQASFFNSIPQNEDDKIFMSEQWH